MAAPVLWLVYRSIYMIINATRYIKNRLLIKSDNEEFIDNIDIFPPKLC